jgi:hypothetical protein
MKYSRVEGGGLGHYFLGEITLRVLHLKKIAAFFIEICLISFIDDLKKIPKPPHLKVSGVVWYMGKIFR